MGTGKQYDEEFKKQAVKLAKGIGNKAAADELGIPKGTLGTWLHKARAGEISIDIPSEGTVRKVMEQIGLIYKPRRKPNGITKTDRKARKSDDLLKRDFRAAEPLKKAVTDISEVKAKDGKLYVSAIFDCFDLMPLGLSIEDNIGARIKKDQLKQKLQSDITVSPTGIYLGMSVANGEVYAAGQLDKCAIIVRETTIGRILLWQNSMTRNSSRMQLGIITITLNLRSRNAPLNLAYHMILTTAGLPIKTIAPKK